MTKEQVELIKAGDAHWITWKAEDGSLNDQIVYYLHFEDGFRTIIPKHSIVGNITESMLLSDCCEYVGPVPEPVRDRTGPVRDGMAEPDKESLGGLTSTVIDLIDQRIIEHLCSVFNTSEEPEPEPVKPVYPHYILVLEHTRPIMVGPMVFQNPTGTFSYWTGKDWSPFRDKAYQFPYRESTLEVIEKQGSGFIMRVEEVRE